MDLDDGVPFFFGHGKEHAVAQDACVVDDYIKPAESINGLIDDIFGTSERTDVISIGNSLTASGFNFVGYVLGGTSVASAAIS